MLLRPVTDRPENNVASLPVSATSYQLAKQVLPLGRASRVTLPPALSTLSYPCWSLLLQNDFLFERRLNEYVYGLVAEFSCGKPTLVFCRCVDKLDGKVGTSCSSRILKNDALPGDKGVRSTTITAAFSVL